MTVAGPSRLDRVRRDVLRGLVDENLDTIRGAPKGFSRRQRAQRARRWRRVLGTAFGVAVAGVSVAALMRGGETFDPTNAAVEPAVRTRRMEIPPPVLEPGDVVQRIRSSETAPLFPDVIPVTVGRIALDPGHGGSDGGTSMGYGLLEKDLTSDIAARLARLLTGAAWEVVLTRTEDRSLGLRSRAEIANTARADVFVSIHVNWLPDRTARGFETYYLGPTDDPFLRRLATMENRDSGFSLADYRDLLHGVYADVRHDQSRSLAREIQRTLFATLSAANPEIVSRGVMTAPFAVLVATEMPAVLVEVACLSNDREARLLALPSYRQRIADALFDGITHYAATVTAPAVEHEKGRSSG